MILNEAVDFRADLWSIGALLFETLHGYPPYKTKEEVLQGNLKFGNISSEAKNLIFSLLQQNPEDRLELLSIFNDTWMMQHQQEFKIDFNQYLYKPSKTPPTSHRKETSKSPRELPPVKPLQQINPEVYENPFTTPPKMSPLSNNKGPSSQRGTSQNGFVSKPDPNLEMSFQEQTQEEKSEVVPSLNQREKNYEEQISPSLRKSKSRGSYISSNHQEKKRFAEEQGLMFDGSPQKEREKENIIDNPELAREWLDNRKADKE